MQEVPILHADRDPLESTFPCVVDVLYDRVPLVNLAGDYAYLSEAYYTSLDAELKGVPMLPTTTDALEATVVPTMIDRLARAGIPAVPSSLVNDRFPPTPFHAWPVQPATVEGEWIVDEETLVRRRAGLTLAGKYAVSCRPIHEADERVAVRIVLGRTTHEAHEAIAAAAFCALRIPAMTLWLVGTEATGYRVCTLAPLPFDRLGAIERSWIDAAGEVRGWRA